MPRSRPASLAEALPGLRRTGAHLRPYLRAERRVVVLGLLALAAEVVFRVLEPWPIKFVIDAVVPATDTTQPGGRTLHQVLLVSAVALVLIVALRALAAYAMTLCFSLAGNRLLTRVRHDAFAHAQRLSMGFHDRAATGDLVTRITSDVSRLKEVSVTAGLPLVGNVATMLGMLAVVAALDWQLALLMLVVLPAFFVTGARLGRRIHAVSRTQRAAEGALASSATEVFSSMRVIQSYSLEQRMQAAFAGDNEKTLKDGVKAKRLSAGLERRTDVLVGVATALVLYVGATRVVAGALTLGELVVFLTYLKATFKPLRDMAKYTARIAQAAASGERLVDLLEEVPTVVDRSWARPARRFRGDVRFEGVSLAYTPGHPVLDGFDLHIRAGETLGLVGPSGSGKSSVAMLLSRLRDPDAGRVVVDGHDLPDLTTESVRAQVAVVLQESLLFATSIRENIALGKPGATTEEIETAARLAGAHDFVMRLPQGYDTVVGERGSTLSGGQRQRIAIARAAVRDAPIVVLDEAMTGLDGATEQEVVAALHRLVRGRTTLVITHDLDAVRSCDRLAWLEGGRVVSCGTPDEVLERCAPRGATRELVHA